MRVDDETRPAFEDAGMEPFAYDTRSKRVTGRSFYATPEELFDDADEFRDWARTALAVAQGAARAKAAKKTRR